MKQEGAEGQRKGIREFVGTFGSFSFHLPPDRAPLRLCVLLLKLPFQTVSEKRPKRNVAESIRCADPVIFLGPLGD